MRGLKNKVVAVTGSASGIGRAIALRFGAEGALVALLDINEVGAQDVAETINAAGGKALAFRVDITDRPSVETAIATVEKSAAPIDVLVNNAGWDIPIPFVDTDRTFWDKVIAVNLYGPLNMHHVMLPLMMARKKGRIVNIASDAGRVGSSGEAVYSACKGGVIAFTKTIAREAARANINVNCVCPGPTDTPLFDAFKAQSADGAKIADGLARAIPFRRLGTPDDYPGIVAFLASDDAAYITGQVISVSGGLTMHG